MQGNGWMLSARGPTASRPSRLRSPYRRQIRRCRWSARKRWEQIRRMYNPQRSHQGYRLNRPHAGAGAARGAGRQRVAEPRVPDDRGDIRRFRSTCHRGGRYRARKHLNCNHAQKTRCRGITEFVHDVESWPAQVEVRLRISMVNAGVPGYGIDQMVLRAETLLDAMKPRALVVSLIPNWIGRNELSINIGMGKPYFDHGRAALQQQRTRKISLRA